MSKTNFSVLMDGLGAILAIPDARKTTNEALNMIKCPMDIDEDADCLEVFGFPTEEQCCECKREWLKAKVKA